jgi:hypothetical protein
MSNPDERKGVWIEQGFEADRLMMRLTGVLDGGSYRAVRDAIVKVALDQPAMILIDVSALLVPNPSAWSVFTSARWLVHHWPEVPIGLLCTDVAGRRVIRRNGIERYVPLYGNTESAKAALQSHTKPPRRRMRQTWPAEPWAVSAAQRFVARWLTDWAQEGFVVTASVIAKVLVDNVLRHTDSDPDLRLESDGATVTVAVTDGSSTPAGALDDAEVNQMLKELHIVAALSRVWGNTPISGGKVVWAVMGAENQL